MTPLAPPLVRAVCEPVSAARGSEFVLATRQAASTTRREDILGAQLLNGLHLDGNLVLGTRPRSCYRGSNVFFQRGIYYRERSHACRKHPHKRGAARESGAAAAARLPGSIRPTEADAALPPGSIRLGRRAASALPRRMLPGDLAAAARPNGSIRPPKWQHPARFRRLPPQHPKQHPSRCRHDLPSCAGGCRRCLGLIAIWECEGVGQATAADTLAGVRRSDRGRAQLSQAVSVARRTQEARTTSPRDRF